MNQRVIQRGLDWRKLSSYGLSLPAIRKIELGNAVLYRAPPRRFNFTSINVTIPYWSILAAIGLPTALAWLLDRRRLRPGHCPCGYDLTGNVSGTCPECGIEDRIE